MTVVNLGAQVLVPDLVDTRPRGARGCRARLAGRHPEGRPHPQHHGDVGRLPRGLPGRPVPAAGRRRAALRARAAGRRSASTGSSAGAPPPVRWPRYLVHASSSRTAARPPDPRVSAAMTRAEVGLTRHPPPLRALQPRPLRRQPRRRGVLASRRSVTSPPRCASAPTATRACSPRTPTSQFLAPVRAGDVIEIEARLVRVGTRSREMEFEVRSSAVAAPTAARPPRTCSTRPWSRPPPAGSSWCPRRRDLPLAGAHPAPVCRRARLPPSPPVCACGWRSRRPTSGGSPRSVWPCSPGRPDRRCAAGCPAGPARGLASSCPCCRGPASTSVRCPGSPWPRSRRSTSPRCRPGRLPGRRLTAPAHTWRAYLVVPWRGWCRSALAAPPPSAGSPGRGWRSARPTARWRHVARWLGAPVVTFAVAVGRHAAARRGRLPPCSRAWVARRAAGRRSPPSRSWLLVPLASPARPTVAP